MLTGDKEEVGRKVAESIGITHVFGNLLPGDKVAKVEQLLAEKPEGKTLAFVGDGINDAPVLARADVGIAMGGICLLYTSRHTASAGYLNGGGGHVACRIACQEYDWLCNLLRFCHSSEQGSICIAVKLLLADMCPHKRGYGKAGHNAGNAHIVWTIFTGKGVGQIVNRGF